MRTRLRQVAVMNPAAVTKPMPNVIMRIWRRRPNAVPSLVVKAASRSWNVPPLCPGSVVVTGTAPRGDDDVSSGLEDVPVDAAGDSVGVPGCVVSTTGAGALVVVSGAGARVVAGALVVVSGAGARVVAGALVVVSVVGERVVVVSVVGAGDVVGALVVGAGDGGAVVGTPVDVGVERVDVAEDDGVSLVVDSDGVTGGVDEGVSDGVADGVAEGVVENVAEGVAEGVSDGVSDGEGDSDGDSDGEGEGEGVGDSEVQSGSPAGVRQLPWVPSSPVSASASGPPISRVPVRRAEPSAAAVMGRTRMRPPLADLVGARWGASLPRAPPEPASRPPVRALTRTGTERSTLGAIPGLGAHLACS